MPSTSDPIPGTIRANINPPIPTDSLEIPLDGNGVSAANETNETQTDVGVSPPDDVNAALKQHGVPSSVLATLSVEQASAMRDWLDSRDHDSKLDSLIRKLGITPEGDTGADETAPAGVKAPRAAPVVDWDALAGHLGQEAVGGLRALEASLRGQYEKAVKQYEGVIQSIAGTVEKFVVESNRSRLAPSYPEIRQKGEYDKVLRLAGALLRTGEYDEIDSAMDAAAALVFKRSAKVGAGQRAAGGTTAPNRAGEKPLTIDQLQDRILTAIMAGRPDEARRLGESYARPVPNVA
jgi:hypothetical protein